MKSSIIQNNELLWTFKELKGNPKWSIITEPLWFIPASLFMPFASIYMYEIGLSQLEIGVTITIGMILQAFFAFISGALTDKYGRKNTTFVFDFIAWSLPCFVWAFAQNFWWFLIASMLNAVYQVTNTSWTCLFIEDCPDEHVINAFTLIQLAGMLSVFFAPITIVLMEEYSLISVVRGLYIFSGISMGLKFLLLYIYGGETRQGKIRMEQTKNTPFIDLLKGNKEIFLTMIKNSKIGVVILFMGISGVSVIATTNFYSIYLTETLGLSEKIVAISPMIRTGVMLAFVVGIQKILNSLSLKTSISLGLGISILSHVFLIISPPKSIAMVLMYTLFEAIGFAVFAPRKEALMTLYVDKQERSRTLALLNTIMIIITAPFGWIVGSMAQIDGRYPFILNIVLFAIGILAIQTHKEKA